ncbi:MULTISPECIES: LysR substrate-binding domain-containing protein [Azospirillaceae]|uniref:LysR substrate-binding domain-containing protein n=1 Tax=Azospirillaceae TaxID=2829815 RepID=UPI000B72CE3E|nr:MULTISPECIES: LysR substrate-binding domain-containing protein [Azospirillaceae]MDG5493753.1 LysR substrate-binding domain-containing protein [Niveispirillum sp. BGYR6]SNS14101.1 aminoethylphosphonate catabolism associated LysR family transcriptional regulator [Azospirillum sp. RU38E]SNS31257.1 aminoethylphosphonate catabolism associated LysR family transcriptional regulator [Azospirillum sp. RU37A]
MLHTQLRAFHWVAREGSFTLAARALAISQPTLSAEVKALEERYGIMLFLRERRGVTLTQAGQALQEITHRLFAAEQEALELLSGHRALTGGTLNVGADGPVLAIPLVAEFTRRHPGVKLRLSLGNAETIRRDLLEMRLDVAVLASPTIDPRLTGLPLGRDQVMVMMPASHRLAACDHVDPVELTKERVLVREPGSMTRRVVERVLAEAELVLTDTIEIASREAQLAAVKAGMGLAFICKTEFSGDSDMVLRPLQGLRIDLDEYVLCLRDRSRLGIVRAFLAVGEAMAGA